MKKKTKIIFLLLVFYAGTWIIQGKASAQEVFVSFQIFYDELSPYGTWVNNYNYGYVWIPNVAPGFTPYATNGYWILTNEGWTWFSNYPWGWAPFHYGRWDYDPYYGPIWIPDNEWGPGWVSWRRTPDYFGWAPIGPGISISVAYGNSYNVPYNQWTFVRGRDFGRRNINNYYINNSNNVTIINNSTVINNIRVNKTRNVRYNTGPDRADVEKHIGKTITPVTIKESSKPVQKLNENQLQIYRPQVKKTGYNVQKPAPSKVVSLKDVKSSAQRTNETPSQKANQPAKQKPSQTQRANSPLQTERVKQSQQTKSPQKTEREKHSR